MCSTRTYFYVPIALRSGLPHLGVCARKRPGKPGHHLLPLAQLGHGPTCLVLRVRPDAPCRIRVVRVARVLLEEWHDREKVGWAPGKSTSCPFMPY